MRGGNRLFGSETALVDSLLSSSGFWKPPKARTEHTVSIHTHTHTHTHMRALPRKHATSMPSRLYKCAQTCTRYFVWANVTGAKKKVATLFLFSFSSFFFFVGVRWLSYREKEFIEEKEKKRRAKRLLDPGGRAATGGGGAVISITVPFGNRDNSMSNKKTKPRQIALTWGCNLSTPPAPP